MADDASKRAVTAYVRAWIDKQRKETDRTWEEIGAEVGVTKPAVYNVWKGQRGVGGDLESGFAAKFFGGSVDELRRAAMAAAPAEDPSVPPSVRGDDPRERAIARLRGLLSDEVLASVRGPGHPGAEAFTEADWIDLAMSAQRRHAAAQARASNKVGLTTGKLMKEGKPRPVPAAEGQGKPGVDKPVRSRKR